MPRSVKEIPSFVYDPSCVLYVPLWKRDGSTFISDDAYGHLCTVTGATWGIKGRTLDGIGNFIDAGNHASLNITDAITIEVWVKRTSLSAGVHVILSKALTTGDLGYDIRFNDNYFGFVNHGVAEYNSNSQITDTTNCHHLVMTYDRINVKHYIDGALDKTTAATAAISTSNANLRLGVYSSDTPAYYFPGLIGEVLISSRALSAAEIMNNYLVTKWRFSG